MADELVGCDCILWVEAGDPWVAPYHSDSSRRQFRAAQIQCHLIWQSLAL